ncbi:TetR/AcrR family transcriptional regulator [Amycolatopsis albispora]|uniref:Transcriptional regulator n=1 Tax=Amycolatopsis albispora TaxID=1804986 RepID=A0A344L1Z1_9PSEU|nr:TetR/AcrR family transcriptional regulator C-terminal domain-containing protein [Amycolatopsis albispora]AXB42065.1 transcriptional regulator [Amycolatopsis albispora]
MPRPRSLTPDQIAGAALAVLDRDGLGSLSMRAVAGELGMGTMSLYRYVTDREQLEGLIVELVLGGIDLGVDPAGPWQERLATLAGRMRAAVGGHPAVVPLLLTHRHSSLSSARWGEAVLEVLTDAGFTGKRRVIAFRVLIGYLLGALQAEHLGPLSGSGTEALAALPEAEFPRLSETARRARRIGADEEFRCGLSVVLHGLEADGGQR